MTAVKTPGTPTPARRLPDASRFGLIRFPAPVRVSMGFGTDAFNIATRRHI